MRHSTTPPLHTHQDVQIYRRLANHRMLAIKPCYRTLCQRNPCLEVRNPLGHDANEPTSARCSDPIICPPLPLKRNRPAYVCRTRQECVRMSRSIAPYQEREKGA